ncbi:two-component sensor histidine kinase [Cryobacterium frigoriphilum]|uniref:histidine kinase n=1 Tax=Cryobacterium frigoriphilum TaxID=1259150 RepID=A0A4R9A5Q2_9MICO|nr:histidine kinase [Cryobacterium frigoriphilum]TFD52116.1 two-component sensor histidine kinase [Cryobacterium frigoriphilum]
MSTSNSSPGGHTAPGGELRTDAQPQLLLPTPPGVARRFWARHPWLTDVGVVLCYLLPLLLVTGSPGDRSVPELVNQGVVIVVVSIALLFRRHAPLLVLTVSAAGLFVSYPVFSPADTFPLLIALYAVAVYRGAGSAWIGFGASAVAGFLAAGLRPGELAWIAVGSQYAVTMLAATLIGVNVGNRKRYVGALLDLAAQLAAERDRQARLARVAERARIAREMHDVIAHSLSVMVALADGSSAVATSDPARAQTAMREVATTGRASLAEMRRLLGVLTQTEMQTELQTELQTQTQALRPQPGLEQLAELVETYRGAGLPTRLEMEGAGPDNPGLQLAIYRVVQESLTNALRYAARSTLVTVRVRMHSDRVEIVVCDNSATPSAPSSQGSGRGLIGLQERVALYGGTLEAGPRPDGGWQVRATLNVDAAPNDAAPNTESFIDQGEPR